MGVTETVNISTFLPLKDLHKTECNTFVEAAGKEGGEEGDAGKEEKKDWEVGLWCAALATSEEWRSEE